MSSERRRAAAILNGLRHYALNEQLSIELLYHENEFAK